MQSRDLFAEYRNKHELLQLEAEMSKYSDSIDNSGLISFGIASEVRTEV